MTCISTEQVVTSYLFICLIGAFHQVIIKLYLLKFQIGNQHFIRFSILICIESKIYFKNFRDHKFEYEYNMDLMRESLKIKNKQKNKNVMVKID